MCSFMIPFRFRPRQATRTEIERPAWRLTSRCRFVISLSTCSRSRSTRPPTPSAIRLDKRTFDAISTHSRVQGTREGSAFEFGVDIDQDLVRAVTGTPDDAALGHKLSGMDALHCGVR